MISAVNSVKFASENNYKRTYRNTSQNAVNAQPSFCARTPRAASGLLGLVLLATEIFSHANVARAEGVATDAAVLAAKEAERVIATKIKGVVPVEMSTAKDARYVLNEADAEAINICHHPLKGADWIYLEVPKDKKKSGFVMTVQQNPPPKSFSHLRKWFHCAFDGKTVTGTRTEEELGLFQVPEEIRCWSCDPLKSCDPTSHGKYVETSLLPEPYVENGKVYVRPLDNKPVECNRGEVWTEDAGWVKSSSFKRIGPLQPIQKQ